MLHGPARFERGQNRVGVHRRTLENFISERIREGVQDGGTSARNRRLADTTSAHRRLRVWNVQRRPLHVDGHIENRRGFALVKALGKHLAVLRIEYPFLTDRMADTERRTAEHLATQCAGMNHRPYIAGGEKV